MPPATVVIEGVANDSVSPVNVILWGDYEESGSADADRILRRFFAQNPGRYEFRRFPISKQCNPAQEKEPEDRHKNACRMIAAVEAAAALGGEAAARQAHVWLMENGRPYSDEKLRAAAPQFGLSADDLLAKMDELDVSAAARPDIDTAQRLGLKSLPWIYLNGKLVTRHVFEGQPVLETLLQEAAKP
jgi:protein-disulfide isomerase